MRPSSELHRNLACVGNGPDSEIDLAETALSLAASRRPGVSLDPYRRHLARLVSEVGAYLGRARMAGRLELRTEALRQVVARRYGYAGAKHVLEDPDGANLMRVIDHRIGLPVAIGIIYIHVARRLGWTIDGLDFPGLFLLRLEHRGERIVLDPNDGLRVLTARDMRASLKAAAGNHAEMRPGAGRVLGNRDILLRLEGARKRCLLSAERIEDALAQLETMLILAPDEAPMWREVGLLNARLDQVPEAVSALEEYLRLGPGAGARYRTSVLLRELRLRLR